MKMFEGIWTIVEMRGPSVVSLLCIMFLLYIDITQGREVKRLRTELDQAKEAIYSKFGKVIEATNRDIAGIRTDVGKQTEAIKSLCVTLDNVQMDIRQIRELNKK